MRISDWSSDVCSSDLLVEDVTVNQCAQAITHMQGREWFVVLFVTLYGNDQRVFGAGSDHLAGIDGEDQPRWVLRLLDLSGHQRQAIYLYEQLLLWRDQKIGRASCRERVCQYV